MKTPDQTDNPLLNELDNQKQRITELEVLENEHKQTEKKLRESEERLRIILESIATPIFYKDIKGTYLGCNAAYLDFIGLPRENVIGRTISEIAPPELAEMYLKADQELIQSGKSQVNETIFPFADGSTHEVIFHKAVYRNLEGAASGLVGVMFDISERKRAEKALRESEKAAQRLAQENAAMAEIGRIISSTLNIDEVYELFSEKVKSLLPYDRIVINMIDIEKGLVKNVYMSGERVPGRIGGEIYPLKGSGNAEMVRTKSTVLIQTEDFDEYKGRLPELMSTFQAGFRSIMNVPLFSKGKIIGGLLLRSLKPYAYTDKDLRIAERIGNQIAGAIANAQLYLELAAGEATVAAEKKKAEELEALNQQLRASEQQLRTSEQQLKAANQQLEAKEQALQKSQTQLMEKLAQVERFNKIMVGRELKMIKLKEEINSLLEEMGKPKKY